MPGLSHFGAVLAKRVTGLSREAEMNDAKTELGRKILAIKQERKLTWADIAAELFAHLDLCRLPRTDVDDAGKQRRRHTCSDWTRRTQHCCR